VIEEEGETLYYMAQRGEVQVQGGAQSQGQLAEGVSSTILVECKGDRRLRMAIWFGPDPDPEAPGEKLDLTGTPGDPEAIRAFMAHFDTCD
jgi:hypothetical protein